MLRITSLGLSASALAVAAAVLTAAHAQMPRDPHPPFPKPMPQVGVYEGTSMSGSLQEALDGAVARALMDQPGTMGGLRYRVVEVSGSATGGSNTLHVSIQLEALGKRPSTAVDLQR